MWGSHKHSHTHTSTRQIRETELSSTGNGICIYTVYIIVLWACVYTSMWISTAENTLSIVLSHTLFPPTHSLAPSNAVTSQGVIWVTRQSGNHISTTSRYSVRMYISHGVRANDSACQTKAFNAFSLITATLSLLLFKKRLQEVKM